MPKKAVLDKTKLRQKLFISLSVFTIALSFANVLISGHFQKQQKVLAASTVDVIQVEIDFWKEIIRSHPTYRDAYIELAKLYKQKGLEVAAKQTIDKALEIDPHSENIRKFFEEKN